MTAQKRYDMQSPEDYGYGLPTFRQCDCCGKSYDEDNHFFAHEMCDDQWLCEDCTVENGATPRSDLEVCGCAGCGKLFESDAVTFVSESECYCAKCENEYNIN